MGRTGRKNCLKCGGSLKITETYNGICSKCQIVNLTEGTEGFVFRENKHIEWLENHKKLLERQFDERCIIKASKKRLKVIDYNIFRNNEDLRKQ